MQLIDEIFLFLVRLKFGLFEQDTAHRFQIHMSYINKKFTTWANYLYFNLGSPCIWPSKNEVQDNMPEGFRLLYSTTRVILDCNEIFVQTPTSLLLQSKLYSSYKCNITSDLLEPTDSVMTDNYFNIDDLLREKGVGQMAMFFSNRFTASSKGKIGNALQGKSFITYSTEIFCW